jgi:hypothetical protein
MALNRASFGKLMTAGSKMKKKAVKKKKKGSKQ